MIKYNKDPGIVGDKRSYVQVGGGFKIVAFGPYGSSSPQVSVDGYSSKWNW